eukprot:s1716_g5.t1
MRKFVYKNSVFLFFCRNLTNLILRVFHGLLTGFSLVFHGLFTVFSRYPFSSNLEGASSIFQSWDIFGGGTLLG